MSNRLPVVNLVDVNNLLHIGNHTFGNYSVTDVAGNKIKTGGMYMVLSLLRRKVFHHTGNTWIFCFDRKSHRREIGLSLGIDYKTGRTKMPSHLMVQSNELFNWLPKIGYNALAIDGLEADDIINSIVNLLKDQPVRINILSTDRDMAFNVTNKCDLISSNSRVPSVTTENYEATVGVKGHYVEYNTILLYKVICGDKSDGIPPISDESYALYKTVCKKLKDMGIDLSNLANFEILEKCLSVLGPELKEKAMDNWTLVKPYIMPTEMIKLNPQTIDKEALYEFCSIFGMKAIAKKFDIELGEFPESVTKYRLETYKRTVELETNNNFDENSEESEYKSEGKNGVERLKVIDSLSSLVTGSVNTLVENEIAVTDTSIDNSNSVSELDETFENKTNISDNMNVED